MKNKMMAMLIKKNHCLPKNLRKDLWMLSSGALKTKSNNPEYEFYYDLFNFNLF